MFDTILAKFSGYIIVALVTLLLASAGVNGYQSHEIGKLAVENSNLSTDLDAAQRANKTDEGSIDTLTAQLAAEVKDHRIDKQKAAAALQAALQGKADAVQQLANLQQQRSKDYADDAIYRAWSDALAPDSTGERLRCLAAASDGNAGPGVCGGDAGAGGDHVDGAGDRGAGAGGPPE